MEKRDRYKLTNHAEEQTASLRRDYCQIVIKQKNKPVG